MDVVGSFLAPGGLRRPRGSSGDLRGTPGVGIRGGSKTYYASSSFRFLILLPTPVSRPPRWTSQEPAEVPTVAQLGSGPGLSMPPRVGLSLARVRCILNGVCVWSLLDVTNMGSGPGLSMPPRVDLSLARVRCNLNGVCVWSFLDVTNMGSGPGLSTPPRVDLSLACVRCNLNGVCVWDST